MNELRLVVVGVSLGALAALRALLGGLPADFAPPIVIACHRRPGSTDMLSGALQQSSGLPVVEPDDKDPLEPRHVYVGPADYHLLVGSAGFELNVDPAVNHARPSIDVLFESAALGFGPGVVAVVLTGASADGARGAALIKRCGGRVIVQDPATAERREMPDAALAQADWVLALDQIGPELGRLACTRREARP